MLLKGLIFVRVDRSDIKLLQYLFSLGVDDENPEVLKDQNGQVCHITWNDQELSDFEGVSVQCNS